MVEGGSYRRWTTSWIVPIIRVSAQTGEPLSGSGSGRLGRPVLNLRGYHSAPIPGRGFPVNDKPIYWQDARVLDTTRQAC